jgi:hypothetical protein
LERIAVGVAGLVEPRLVVKLVTLATSVLRAAHTEVTSDEYSPMVAESGEISLQAIIRLTYGELMRKIVARQRVEQDVEDADWEQRRDL